MEENMKHTIEDKNTKVMIWIEETEQVIGDLLAKDDIILLPGECADSFLEVEQIFSLLEEINSQLEDLKSKISKLQ